MILFPQIYPVACHTDNIGPDSIFVAIKGMKDDGSRYIIQAAQRGAREIVLQEDVILSTDIESFIAEHTIKITRVVDTRLALAQLSAEKNGFPAQSMRIIAITGTKGKTTTTYLTEHILRTAGYKTALLSTVKNRILDQEFTAPLTTAQPDYLHVFLRLCKEAGVEYVVMETAAQAYTLHRLHGIEFDCALWTNFSQEHAEFYATMDDYFAAKARIITHLKSGHPLFINSDDETLPRLYDMYTPVFDFSVGGSPSYVALEVNGCEFDATLHDNKIVSAHVFTAQRDYTIPTMPLLGQFNIYNVAAALSIAEYYAIPTADILQAQHTFGGVPGRLYQVTMSNGIRAYIDYAHNPSSFDAVLTTLRLETDQLIVVFGAGGERDPIKRPLMGEIAARIADIVILTNDNPRSEEPENIIQDIRAGIGLEYVRKVWIELDRKKAIELAYGLATQNAIIALLGKGPDEYQLIQGNKIPFSEQAILRSL